MMKASHHIACNLLLFAAILLSGNALGQRLYKWVDANGQVHYSNRLPPEASRQERAIINEQGRTLKVYRPLTAEEKAEQKRIEALEKRKHELAEKRAIHDRSLIASYSSTDDMYAAMAEKLASVESVIKLIDSRIRSLQQRLLELTEDAANYERSGKPMPDSLQRQISNLREQIVQNEAYTKDKQKEMEDIRLRYKHDIQRFTELTTGKQEVTAARTEPATDKQETTAARTEPATGTQEITAARTEPATGTQEVTAASTEPATGTQEVTAARTEPATGTQKATAARTEPATGTQEITAAKTEVAPGAEEPRTAQEVAKARPDIELTAQDQTLLATFDTEDDLLFAHEQEVSSLNAAIDQTATLLDAMQMERGEITDEILEYQINNRKPPGRLNERMQALIQEIDAAQATLDQQRSEKQALEYKFAVDILRYRKLTASN